MSPEECHTKCEDEPRCSMWTWGKTRDVAVAGMSDVCFLKELTDLETLRRRFNDLAVSGMSCQVLTDSESSPDASGPREHHWRAEHSPADVADAACQEMEDNVELRTSRSVD